MLRLFISSVQKEFASERTALREPHGSVPGNPLVAEPLYLTQYIERMGTGTRDMIRRCREAGLPEPVFTVTDGFVITLRRPTPPTGQATPQVAPQLTPQVTPQATTQVTTQDNPLEKRLLEELAVVLRLPTTQVTTQVAGQVVLLLRAASEPATRESLQDATGLRNREHFRQTYMEPLVAAGWLELTVPDKPTSRLQKYRLTEKGRAWLAARPTEPKV
jgi:predicted HTH transcriptional regulator